MRFNSITTMALVLMLTSAHATTLTYHLFRPKHAMITAQMKKSKTRTNGGSIRLRVYHYQQAEEATPEVIPPPEQEMLQPADITPQQNVQVDVVAAPPVEVEVDPQEEQQLEKQRELDEEAQKERDLEEQGVDPKGLSRSVDVDLSQGQQPELTLLAKPEVALDPKIKKIDIKLAEADMLESWNPVTDSNEQLPPDDFVDDYVEEQKNKILLGDIDQVEQFQDQSLEAQDTLQSLGDVLSPELIDSEPTQLAQDAQPIEAIPSAYEYPSPYQNEPEAQLTTESQQISDAQPLESQPEVQPLEFQPQEIQESQQPETQALEVLPIEASLDAQPIETLAFDMQQSSSELPPTEQVFIASDSGYSTAVTQSFDYPSVYQATSSGLAVDQQAIISQAMVDLSGFKFLQ